MILWQKDETGHDENSSVINVRELYNNNDSIEEKGPG